jgi:Na+:H+ antiporter, NhaA family
VSRPSSPPLPSAQLVAERVFGALDRFLHVEAVSGIVLLVAAAAALLWANSPQAASYDHLWHLPLTIGVGDFVLSQSLHFIINDGLMTIFFLVVGMEIRREIHEGALSNLRLATLPLAAALGGVVAPALIYLAFNPQPGLREGWAIPTATDIAFAVGVLALLGRSIPGSVRVFLLALAIIDDIAAVLIIALFYSGGVDLSGLVIAGAGVLLVLGFQQIGLRSAWSYVVPGAVLWYGLLQTGVHPTLAGVALGLLTPVTPLRGRERPMEAATRALSEFDERAQADHSAHHELMQPLKRLERAQRELLPPVVRVQLRLHPWVAYGIMPLFALANAGVHLGGVDLDAPGPWGIALGVFIALVLGKPLGIMLGTWIAVRLRWCQLPADMNWLSVLLIGCLGGIGFTMSIFIANLAFMDGGLLAAAKSGVLLASLTAGIIGLLLGRAYTRSVRQRSVALQRSAAAAEEEMSGEARSER